MQKVQVTVSNFWRAQKAEQLILIRASHVTQMSLNEYGAKSILKHRAWKVKKKKSDRDLCAQLISHQSSSRTVCVVSTVGVDEVTKAGGEFLGRRVSSAVVWRALATCVRSSHSWGLAEPAVRARSLRYLVYLAACHSH